MTIQLSFTKVENELLPDYRKKIGAAESTEDVKKFFVYTIQELLLRLSEGKIRLAYDDITLVPELSPAFAVRGSLLETPDFSAVWQNSDLPSVVGRFAETAVNHFRHLEKNRQKTEAKIRM